jgi:hypothetical protein
MAARGGRTRGGHGLWDGSCEAAAAQPLWQGVAGERIFASEPERKSGFQSFYWSRRQLIDKPRFRARKWILISFSPAWISFSLGLEFLQPGLEFLQPGLEFLRGGPGGHGKQSIAQLPSAAR